MAVVSEASLLVRCQIDGLVEAACDVVVAAAAEREREREIRPEYTLLEYINTLLDYGSFQGTYVAALYAR